MIFMLICTEGEVSEPAFLSALCSNLKGQAPKNISTKVEIIPLPLGGNHGHRKLIEVANTEVEKYCKNEDNYITLAGKDDRIEKWIVVDYDKMNKRGVDPKKLREEAKKNGYTLVINNPNFEFFILATLACPGKTISSVKPNYLTNEINMHILSLNKEDTAKGFGKNMLMPLYSKKLHVADKLFSGMLGYHPELIDKAANLNVDVSASHYTEMPKLLKQIQGLYK